MIAVVGAGAMGAALAVVHARAGSSTALLGTRLDDASIEACRSGAPHPALGVPLPSKIRFHRHDEWRGAFGHVERVVVAVSSDGLADVVAELASLAPARALWAVATKGWNKASLRTPSEIVGSASGGERVVVLAGPALAPELVAGAPTAMVCAAARTELAREVAATLRSAGVEAEVTDDVAAVEIAAAYKNVTAIAVGICEGLGERLPERVWAHSFADARGAMFALGLRDMNRLALRRGGRPETILGPAGAGDLYVTCLGGRNGKFGRLLGAGQTPDQARATIGSTVEGVANSGAALAIAGRLGVEIDAARAVEAVLTGEMPPETAVKRALRSIGTE